MANSKIIINFEAVLLHNQYVEIQARRFSDNTNIYQRETWQDNPRVQPGQIQVDNTDPLNPNVTAFDFYRFFQLDYNSGGLYTITYIGTQVILEFYNNDYEFTNLMTNSDDVIFTIENITESTYKLTDTVIETAASICSHVRATFTTSENTVKYIVNGVETNIAPATVFSYDFPRNQLFEIILEDDSGEQIQYPSPPVYDGQGNIIIESPQIIYGELNENNVNVFVTPSEAGATVSFNVDEDTNLDLEYSLNDLDWSSSNIVTGQASGDYTVYIRDQFGCKISVDYSVTQRGTKDPYHYISKANDFDFVLLEDVDNINTFRNDINSFMSDSKADIVSCPPQFFTDKITNVTQIKTNFTNVSAKLRKEDGSEVPLLVSKESDNLNRFDSYDAWLYKYDDNYAALYYMSGNKYDANDVPTGETFALNGNVPDYGIPGQYISVVGKGIFKVITTIYDLTINRKVIVIDYGLASSVAEQVIAKSTYDVLDFNVYQFEVGWATYGVGIYDIVVELTDDDYDDVIYQSENILIGFDRGNYINIKSYNTNNRDIFYKYGLVHNTMIPLIKEDKKLKDETKVNLGDNKSNVISSDVYPVSEFLFDDLPDKFAIKLGIHLSMENVFIEGTGYLKEGSVELKEIGMTNLISTSVEMIKTNINYNSSDVGNSGIDIGTLPFDIPPVLSIGDGFIKI